MNRLGQDRSQSHGQNRIGQNRIGQNNRIDRTEPWTEHNHTDRMHHGTHTHDYTKIPSRGGDDHGTKRGRARTPCRLARRGDVHEHHVVDDPAREKKPNEGDGSKRIVADQRHLLSIRQWTRHRNIRMCYAGWASPRVVYLVASGVHCSYVTRVSSCFIILKVHRVRHDLDCTLCHLARWQISLFNNKEGAHPFINQSCGRT